MKKFLPVLSRSVVIVIMFWVFPKILVGQATETYVLKADAVFDGYSYHKGWVVVTRGDRIITIGAVGSIDLPKKATTIELPGMTLLPGLIEGHTHLLLHPYNETSWNDQVLKESEAERTLRAGNHARETLMAGFTSARDLGSEGAGYADVGIKQSIEKGVIPGPRLMVAGRAIVASGSYGPKGFKPEMQVPLGAQTADGNELIKVVREQIGFGADVIKVYADYRWGPEGEAQPTFSEEEIRLIVATAKSSGRDVVAHAATAEGIRRAVLAGVRTIEHGDGATKEVLELMKAHDVALCPTLAAGDAILQYRGWKKGSDPEPERIVNKKASFRLAIEVGVPICAGGDAGVFSHGDNLRELEMMVTYGMSPLAVLQSATAINAQYLGFTEKIGQLKQGWKADIIAVEGDPTKNIRQLRKLRFLMKNGQILKQ